MTVVDSAYAQFLRCPSCRSPLVHEGGGLRCGGACGITYPVVAGVPVLLNESRSVFSVAECVDALAQPPRSSPPERRWPRPVLPSLSRSIGTEANLDKLGKLIQRMGPTPRVLVLGGGSESAGVARLRRQTPMLLIETDVWPGPATTLVCDAHDIPFADACIDVVVAQAVLEHVADPYRCVEEIHRVLTPCGVVYAETPFMQQVHGGRYDFTRFTYVGHRRLFRCFEELASGAVCGPGMALAWSWEYFLLSFASGQRGRRFASAVARLSAFWLTYLDRLLIRRRAALDGASALYFLGRRSDRALSDREVVALYKGGAYDRDIPAWYAGGRDRGATRL